MREGAKWDGMKWGRTEAGRERRKRTPKREPFIYHGNCCDWSTGCSESVSTLGFWGHDAM